MEKGEAETYTVALNVISNKLVTGKPTLHVLSDSDPGFEFQPVEPDLEDVYFSYVSKKNPDL